MMDLSELQRNFRYLMIIFSVISHSLRLEKNKIPFAILTLFLPSDGLKFLDTKCLA